MSSCLDQGALATVIYGPLQISKTIGTMYYTKYSVQKNFRSGRKA